MNPGRIRDLPNTAALRVDPLMELHERSVPIRQIACQDNFARQRMETSRGSVEDWGMPAKKPQTQPQPTLRAWRGYRNLTLEQVGNMIGKGPQAIHKWEMGKVPVTLDNLRLLAQAYQTEPARLLAMPEEGELVDRLARAQAVMLAMEAERTERWLGMGEDLAGLEPKKKS